MDALVVARQRRRRGRPHAAARAAGRGRLRRRRDLPDLRGEGVGGPLRPLPLPAVDGAPGPHDPRGAAPRPGCRPHDGHGLAVRGAVGRRRGRLVEPPPGARRAGHPRAVGEAPDPEGEARRAGRRGERPRPVLGPGPRAVPRPLRRGVRGLPRRGAARPLPRLVRVLRGELHAVALDGVRGAPRLRPAGRARGARRRRPGGPGRAGAERLPARRSPTCTSSTSAAGPPGPTRAGASRATRRTGRPATSSTSTPRRTCRRRRSSGGRTRR